MQGWDEGRHWITEEERLQEGSHLEPGRCDTNVPTICATQLGQGIIMLVLWKGRQVCTFKLLLSKREHYDIQDMTQRIQERSPGGSEVLLSLIQRDKY